MRNTLVLTILLSTAFAGCLSGDDADTHAGMESFTPRYDDVQPGTTTGLQFVSQLTGTDGPFPTGAGIWVYGDFVFGSARTERLFIADISDPANPELIFQAPDEETAENGRTTLYARDADLIEHPDGHRTLVLATQFDGMHFWDVTDPYEPEWLSRIFVDPNHNVAVIPGTEYVFNSQSGGQGGFNEIVDASDPRNPKLANAYGTHGCHDITFFGSFGDDMFRGYCAGIDRTEIWDLSGLNPTIQRAGIRLVGTVEFGLDQPVIGNPAYNGYPLRTLHHLAMVNEDASVLIIGDEQNGGGTPGGCYAYADGVDRSTPFGALWFYDISDETDPTLLSWISPPLVAPEANAPAPDPQTIQDKLEEIVEDVDPLEALDLLRPYTANVPNCTAHFGTLVPGEEKMVMAWYSAGVLLIDFSNPAAPFILDQYQPEGTNPWDARIHGGYVYTGDITRGMDVLRLV